MTQDTPSPDITASDKNHHDMRKNARAQRYSLFAHAYLANGRNGYKAAIAAGWNERTAASAASRLLKSGPVRALVEAADAALLKIQTVSEEAIRNELAVLAFAPVGPGVKASDKNKALDSLARMEGLYKEAEEVQRFGYADRLQRALDRKRRRQAQEPEVTP